MLSFAGYTWLLDVRDSPIRARIDGHCRGPEQVHWQVEFNYIAAGTEWRRVKSLLRPSLRLCIYGFDAAVPCWEDLEGTTYTSEEDPTGEHPSGTLFVDCQRMPRRCQNLDFSDYRLRFIRRTGNWFTTELAVYAPAANRAVARESSLPLAGEIETFTPGEVLDPEWSDEAALYLVEDLPFGLVDVTVPVNARKPETYARAKAWECLRLDQVQESDASVIKETIGQEIHEVPGAGWHVRLHSGGRWTHFSLS
jgi:hypothetical protein